jgi:hypothetical protein
MKVWNAQNFAAFTGQRECGLDRLRDEGAVGRETRLGIPLVFGVVAIKKERIVCMENIVQTRTAAMEASCLWGTLPWRDECKDFTEPGMGIWASVIRRVGVLESYCQQRRSLGLSFTYVEGVTRCFAIAGRLVERKDEIKEDHHLIDAQSHHCIPDDLQLLLEIQRFGRLRHFGGGDGDGRRKRTGLRFECFPLKTQSHSYG